MADILFNIFNDHVTQADRNVRQPLSNIENMGKKVSSGPIKPNEPLKKGEVKKSFLANSGTALQNTPLRKAFTPRAVNVGHFIYNDKQPKIDVSPVFEEVEFTKSTNRNDNFHTDIFDYFPLPEENVPVISSSPQTPPPHTDCYSIQLDSSYEDEIFTDEFSNDSLEVSGLGLPDLY